jgi:uncharacterized protein (TIGR03084 family)
MTIRMGDLCDALLAETKALEKVLSPLSEADWNIATPAPGWVVRDQVTHLSYFDETAVQTVMDPAAFGAARTEALADVNAFTKAVSVRFQALPGADVLSWFRESRRRLVEVFLSLDPRQRLSWYGPDMSAASAVTARIMETWAHGQDVVDGLGSQRGPTHALRHIAHLGVSTFANSFQSNNREVPEIPVRVELTGPESDAWEWGPMESANRVRGPALDFCLVVTQRRHLSDTTLQVDGEVARQWMSIAQAFAGPPGAGRRPGQFPGTPPPGNA